MVRRKQVFMDQLLITLRKVALEEPVNLARYIAVFTSELQASKFEFDMEEMLWFSAKTEEIIEQYLGGRLITENNYYGHA